MRVILIDDDEDLVDLLEVYLSKNDIKVSTALTGEEGLVMIEKEKFDLAILDVMMPGMSGIDVLRKITSDHSYLPVIMLTAKGEEVDRILGLEMGADDYIVKPFSSRELLARIRAVERTQKKGREGQEKIDEESLVKLDYKKRQAMVRGEYVKLSAIEFDILDIFVKNKGIVLSRDKIMDLSRGKDFIAYDRSIDMHISRLRQKIEKDPQNPEFLKTVWGMGYIYSGE